MKRSKLKRKSPSKQAVLERKVWTLCKQITRGRYGNTCYTCGAGNLRGSNWHTGHMFPKASLGASMKYDLRILRPQCYHCNINLGGNGARFLLKMKADVGTVRMRRIVEDVQKSKNTTTKAVEHYTELLAQYTALNEGIRVVSPFEQSIYSL